MRHNKAISCTKGLAIVLMVVGHSGAPNFLVNFIYNFHMPLFFFVSGFLFNTKHLENKRHYIIKKIKGLYIPFVMWSLIFLLFHNVLSTIQVYNTQYSLTDFAHKFIQIITMTGSDQLLGGFWFLKQLFYTTIICFFIFYGINKSRRPRFWLVCTIFTVLLIQIFYDFIPFHIPTISSITFNGILFYLTGYLISLYEIRYDNPLIGVSLLILTLILSFVYQGSIETHGYNILIYFFIALLGIIGSIYLCHYMSRFNVLSTTFDKLGEMTLFILIFHFLAFKVVSGGVLYFNDLPFTRLSEFPVIKGLKHGEWIIYTLAGVLFPTALYYLKLRVSKLKDKIKPQKIND